MPGIRDDAPIATSLLASFALALAGADVTARPALLAELVAAHLAEFPLLVLRGQRPEPDALVAALAELGPLERYDPPVRGTPGPAEIAVVANDEERGIVAIPYWHVDGLARETPPRLTAFYALEVPSRGGETAFIDTRAMLAALPEEEREELRALEAILTSGHRHPLVRRDPVLGGEAICVNFRHTTGLTGVERADAERVFAELGTLFRDSDLIYRHSYEPGDLLIWNNFALAHSAGAPLPPGERRLMWRVDVRAAAAA